jgi:Flp pilus assembly protein TadD
MAFFLLSGTLLFLRSARRGSKLLYLVSLPLFFLSMLAKETATIFPLILIAADLTAYPTSGRRDLLLRLARQIGPLVTLGLYLVLRNFYVGFAPSAFAATPPDFFSHILSVLQAVPLYVGLLVFPRNLHFIHRINPSPWNGAIVVSLFLLVVAGWGVRRGVRSGNRGMAFALLWFLIGLLPLVHLTGLNLPLLEGWIYFASGGLFLLVAIGLDRVQRLLPSRLHVWLAVLIAVLLGAATLYRNRDWKDEVQISLHTLKASPDDPLALRLLGNAQFRRARVPEAEQLFQKALPLASGDPRLHESFVRLYDFLGKEAEVLAHYQRMRELTPKDPYPHWRLGRYHLRRKDYARAEEYVAEAVKLFPYSSEIRNDLATAYYLQGKLDAARAELEAALKISPYSPIVRSNLERILRRGPSSSLQLPSQ